MCKARYFILASILLSSVLASRGQRSIPVEELLQKSLDSSYALNSNEYLIQRARVRNTRGFAGNLPSIQTNGQAQVDLNSSRLQFFDGNTRSADNAPNYSAGISLDLNYPLYEAGAKSSRKNQLENQLENTEIQYRMSQQELLREVLQTAAEYNLWKEYVSIYSADTAYWKDLEQLQQQIFAFGRGNRIDLVQIKSELNASIAELVRNQQQLDVLVIRLSDVAFVEEEVDFDSIKMETFLNRAMLASEDHSMPLIEMEKNQIRAAFLATELAKSMQFPVISAFAGYGYNWSRNAVGILLSNQNFGPYAGIRLNWNLYSGNQTKIDIQSAELQAAAERSDLFAVERELDYQKQELTQALLAQQNILEQEYLQEKMLQEQYDIVETQYQEGKINILEVLNYKRQVRLNQLNIAQARYLIRDYKIRLIYNQGSLANFKR